MPLFLAALWGALITVAGSVTGQVLLSLGIGYLTFTGVDASLAWAKAAFLASMGSAPAAVLGLATVMQLGKCVSMLLSAVAMRLVLMGVASGVLKTMRVV